VGAEREGAAEEEEETEGGDGVVEIVEMMSASDTPR
jgi:hypothetical protein